jgi:hypothetical protein
MTATYSRPDGKNRFQIASASERPLFSSWLDQEFNSIYGVLNGLTISDTVSASEWTNVAGTFTQYSTTTFSVSGDLTGVFEPLRAIQFTDPSNVTTTSHIQSSSYTSGTDITTVTVYDAVVPSTISKVTVGLISSESATIPSVQTNTVTANYTVGAQNQIILADDSLSYTGTMVYDDEQVGGDGYPALLITLPQAAYLPNKLLCVKKISGNYRTIVSAHFTHSTTTVDNETVHHNTYDFQIFGDNAAKNRVELKGIGECIWFVSNGTNWYELSPEATELEKGLTRFATSEEMTLTAQQIADGEELSRNLAVSPYQVEKEYMRTDGSNMRFASNYIYKAPNGVASLINNNIVVYSGLGLNVPTGRDENGVLSSKKLELDANLEYAPIEVSTVKKLLFVTYTKTLKPILAKNFFEGYGTPFVTGTQTNDEIIWFDYGSNLLKLSTDNGTNWTTFDGAGPICSYAGNGTVTTSLVSNKALAFMTRDDRARILDSASGYLNTTGSISLANNDTAPSNGTISWYAITQDGASYYLSIDGVVVAGVSSSFSTRGGVVVPIKAGQKVTFSGTCTFFPNL